MNQTNSQSATKPQVPKLFCLVGLPGAGKTFFAEKFAEEYQIPYINLTKWRFLMFAKPNFSSEEDDKLTTYGTDVLQQLFKTKQSVLLEGNLYSQADRQRYAQLAQQYGYQPVVIWVQNVAAESKRRAVRLNRQCPKDFLISAKIFDDLERRFTPPDEAEKPIAISGKHAFEMQYRAVLHRIAKQVSTGSNSRTLAHQSHIQVASNKRRLRVFS